ncbi:hypothetical protein [Capnocytophaga sp.]|uniref:hypothetical protein n=1 Tax=Capnocytophaga sp. TaxID=44737 RepID=UPI0026DD551F|nr:hypothetical protein [Capnocytophaga sp.]MDO5105004.1 hypothetical protein [Capnocytophaga sp.]
MKEKQGFFKSIKIIHLALFLGQAFFGAIVYFLNKDSWKYEFSTSNHLLLVPAIATLVALFAHRIVYKKVLSQAKSKATLAEKLGDFQGACIIQFALIEGTSILCIIFAMKTQNIYSLLLAVALLLYFTTLKPTKEKAITDLELNKEEREALNRNY